MGGSAAIASRFEGFWPIVSAKERDLRGRFFSFTEFFGSSQKLEVFTRVFARNDHSNAPEHFVLLDHSIRLRDTIPERR